MNSVVPQHLGTTTRTRGPFPAAAVERALSDRFEQIVARCPDSVAITAYGVWLTYAELNRAANRIAHAIITQYGVCQEPIALLFEQGLLLWVAIVGVLKAGKLYIALDPGAPHAQTTYMLEDSQIGLIITNSHHVSLANELSLHRFTVLNIDEIDRGISPTNPALALPPSTLGALFYTAGVTGVSQGVVETHRSLLHTIARYTAALGMQADDRVALLQSGSLSCVATNGFSALLNGATLYLFDAQKEGVADLAMWLRRNAITVYFSSPLRFRHVLLGNDVFPAMRVVYLEGDRVFRRDVMLYRAHFAPGCVLINGFASTECGLISQCVLDHTTEIHSSCVPLGVAAPDIEIVLVDDDGVQVAAGQVGEVVVRSQYLALGYWRNPELTTAMFRTDSQGFRTFATGVLGRWLPDGCLEHQGRKVSSSTISGQLLDSADPDALPPDLWGLYESVAFAQEGEGDSQSIEHLAASDTSVPTINTIRRVLAETLPDYLLPSAYVVTQPLSGEADEGMA